jgi:Mrp family chromosome partitioning ATPase
MDIRDQPAPALIDYLHMLWQRRWVVFAALSAALLIAVLADGDRPAPRYEAIVTLGVQPYIFTSDGIVPEQVPGVPPEEIASVRSAEAARETARELGLRDGGDGLLTRLFIRGDDNSHILQVSLTGEEQTTGRELRVYANNYVDLRQKRFRERVQRYLAGIDARIADIESQMSELSRRLEIDESADGVPIADIEARLGVATELHAKFVTLRQNTKLYATSLREVRVLGGPILHRVRSVSTESLRFIALSLVGLLLGGVIAVVIGLLRPLVGDPRRAQERLGLPVLAVLPRLGRRALARDPLALQRRSRSGAEGLRRLRIELELTGGKDRKTSVVLLASPQPEDGRSTVAMNLAASFAQSGLETALLHGNDPAGHKSEISAATADSGADGFDVIFARNDSAAPTGSSNSADESPFPPDAQVQELMRTLQELTENYRAVVIDPPAFSYSPDCLLLAGRADVCLLVVRQSKTREDAAVDLLQALMRHGLRPAGLVVVGARISSHRYRLAASPRPDKSHRDPPPSKMDLPLGQSPQRAADVDDG